jgi:hypothetical protein
MTKNLDNYCKILSDAPFNYFNQFDAAPSLRQRLSFDDRCAFESRWAASAGAAQPARPSPEANARRRRNHERDPSMSLTNRSLVASLSVLCILAALAVAVPPVYGQADSAGVPPNAAADRYGSGWNCNRGFRQVDGGCERVRVPPNAIATKTSFGRGWKCRRGYQEVKETCVPIIVPPNAYLDASGVRWDCRRGFREVDQTCIAIDVPENGFLTESTYGSGWDCERGYRPVADECVRVEIPRNAHLDYSGNDWECDRPYERQGGECVLP